MKCVIIYLHILQNELQKLSEQNNVCPRKRNIRHALNYLRQMNINREKTGQYVLSDKLKDIYNFISDGDLLL